MNKIDLSDSSEYSKLLRSYRGSSDRHVLQMEADIGFSDKCRLFREANLIRICGNELTAIMQDRLDQLFRTKAYKKLQADYADAKKTDNKKLTKSIGSKMTVMQKEYKLTWEDCRQAMIPIYNHYKASSIFGLTKAEDIWRGVEKVLFGNGKRLHFKKKGDFPILRAKKISREIIFRPEENRLWFDWRGIHFICKNRACDRFVSDELSAILEYLKQPEVCDKQAVEHLAAYGECISTYRPCYASLKCEVIRGRMRVFIQLTIEGRAKPKYNKDGSSRHAYGRGRVANDIGTQTVAWTSASETGLKNLAERGDSISHNERRQRLVYRKMDRSRRAMNPGNYNPDGTIKKGPKVWVRSNRYKKLQEQHREACRKSATNRHLAINEDVNHMRSLGNILITEPKNAAKLAKKAKPKTNAPPEAKPPDTPVQESRPKNKRRKRFGKSIQNRCPGYYQEQLKRKFESTDGFYIEVPPDYRASQYDHTVDDYIKKKLNQRMFALADGTKVQRDWYSSFLMYCIDESFTTIDKNKCRKLFPAMYEMMSAMIEEIRHSGIKIMNSGIA